MPAEKKYTVQQLQDWAKIYGGTFLSKEYVTSKTLYKWRCGNGHVFDLMIRYLDQGAWCPRCAKENEKSEALELMQSRPSNLLSGTWCPECAGRTRRH